MPYSKYRYCTVESYNLSAASQYQVFYLDENLDFTAIQLSDTECYNCLRLNSFAKSPYL